VTQSIVVRALGDDTRSNLIKKDEVFSKNIWKWCSTNFKLHTIVSFAQICSIRDKPVKELREPSKLCRISEFCDALHVAFVLTFPSCLLPLLKTSTNHLFTPNPIANIVATSPLTLR